MNGKLSELKSIVNNPNIPKSEKLKEAQRILGDTTKTAQIFHTFTKSAEFKEMPTEEEVMETKQAEAEFREEQFQVSFPFRYDFVPFCKEKSINVDKYYKLRMAPIFNGLNGKIDAIFIFKIFYTAWTFPGSGATLSDRWVAERSNMSGGFRRQWSSVPLPSLPAARPACAGWRG